MKRTYAATLAVLVAMTWLALWNGPRAARELPGDDASPQRVAPVAPADPLDRAPQVERGLPSTAVRRTPIVRRPAVAAAAAASLPSPHAASEHGAVRSAARDSLKGTWYGEPHDEAKTQQIHSFLVETAAAAALPAEVIQETDCGATVCRVLLSFKGPEQALSFQAMAQRPDFQYEINGTGDRPLIAEEDLGADPSVAPGTEPQPPEDGPMPPPGHADHGEQPPGPTNPPAQNGRVELEVMLMASNGAQAPANAP